MNYYQEVRQYFPCRDGTEKTWQLQWMYYALYGYNSAKMKHLAFIRSQPSHASAPASNKTREVAGMQHSDSKPDMGQISVSSSSFFFSLQPSQRDNAEAMAIIRARRVGKFLSLLPARLGFQQNGRLKSLFPYDQWQWLSLIPRPLPPAEGRSGD